MFFYHLSLFQVKAPGADNMIEHGLWKGAKLNCCCVSKETNRACGRGSTSGDWIAFLFSEPSNFQQHGTGMHFMKSASRQKGF